MAESRAIRAVDWRRSRIGRRALDRVGESLRNAVFGSALYRISLRGTRPDVLVFGPADPWSGDPARGGALLRGEYDFGGQSVSASGGPPWRPPGAASTWLEEAHGFTWLRDLEAVASSEARAAARRAVTDWIASCGKWQPLPWRSDVLGRRIVAWLSHHTLILADADRDSAGRILASLAEQARHLARVASTGADGAPRIAAIKGLVFAAICLPGDDRQLTDGLNMLERELERQVRADGGHVERSPSAHFHVYQDVVELRAALIAAKRVVPVSLQGAIDRMAPMLRFFRHGDGGLALFNDSNEESPSAIDAALGLGEATGQPPSSASASRFERMAVPRTLVIVDTGAPPTLASRHTHAGPLSFELSDGRERLIVNCGAHGGVRPEWREAQRATAAHSTVTVDDTNSVEVEPGGAGGGRRPHVTCSRREDEGNIWVEASHDGYRPAFGLTHHRRLYLGAQGADLRGEDVLEGPGGNSFAARFHLHPDVTAGIVGGGAGALLRLPSGVGWRLHAAGARIELAESVYMGRRGEATRCEQVVLTGPLKDGKTTIKWALKRVGSED